MKKRKKEFLVAKREREVEKSRVQRKVVPENLREVSFQRQNLNFKK